MSPKKLRPCSFSAPAKTKLYKIIALTIAMLTSLTSLGQTPTPQPPDSPVASANPTSTTVTVPAGTRIPLVLVHPIQSRYVHHGDDIYAQTTSPVVAGAEVVIPPGTFVQAKVDKLKRKGSRAELNLQSMSITYSNGYVALLTGPITLESDDGYALKDPGKDRNLAGIALPAAGVGMGALIGHSVANSQPNTITSTLPPGCSGPPPGCLSSSVTAPGSTAKDTVIGAMVGGAIGAVASLALLLNTHNFFLDVGSPVEMVLQHPLALQQDQVATVIRDAEQHPAPQEPVSPRPQPLPPSPNNTDTGICYTPGTPGTPGIDIPGTPAVGDSPGTPPIHISGIPPTPPTPYPCP
ncbi:MAG: hypothetical protein WB762_00250 [Candidatus Sulfotelmatobacter sp.]